MRDEIRDSAAIVVGHLTSLIERFRLHYLIGFNGWMLSIVDEFDLESLIQERHFLKPSSESLKLKVSRLKNASIGPKRDSRPRAISCFSLR